MHANELVEVAALLATSAPGLLRQRSPLCEASLTEYWVASRCRLDRWEVAIRDPSAESEPTLLAATEEIILSSVLARVVAAIAVAHDTRQGTAEAEPVARSVLSGNSEIASRASLIVRQRLAMEGERLIALRRLSALASRWSDVLVGYVVHAAGGDARVLAVAHLPSRARDFAEDAPLHDTSEAVNLLLASLRMRFKPAASPPYAGDLNQRLAAAALGLFGAESFDGFGVLKSAWFDRLDHLVDEVTGQIARAVNDDPPNRLSAPRYRNR